MGQNDNVDTVFSSALMETPGLIHAKHMVPLHWTAHCCDACINVSPLPPAAFCYNSRADFFSLVLWMPVVPAFLGH